MTTAVEMAGPWKRIGKACAYVLFLIVVSAIGVELILRASSLVPPSGGFTATEAEFDRIPGLFSPNQSYVDQTKPALPHHITIDSLGYRGENFPRVKPPGEIRIVIAGDSFTFGSFVNDDETLPASLEAALIEGCGPALHTINAGVPSTTIRGQAEMLRRAIPLDPDLALLVFHDNDFVNLSNGPMWDLFKQNRSTKSRFPLSIVYPALRRTALWNISLEARRRWLSRGWSAESATDESGQAIDAAPSAVQDSMAEALYGEHLSALSEAAKGAGVPLLLVAYPLTTPPMTPPDEPRVGAKVISIAETVGVPAFDLYPSIWNSGLSPEDLSLMPDDAHPSPAMHAFVAQVLADKVASLPELQGKCIGAAELQLGNQEEVP